MYIYIYFCYDNSQRDWHCNVHENVNVFGLGGIDQLRCCCARVSTYLLLPIHSHHAAVSM